ncbi:uncharacterized protein PHALS_11373 [Plasmopara halstedii]|uniref:Uncharacterized protein n=1 Tax=Plasmopara halstedii TaxID=4781 RepID=A0A0P1A6D6_PLAHL|nr:uncharacterized protein PHALS_11373 [Plasmopara halstedii]CEG35494.1 hypothetical protein PHALS_11373 [Plasmopara halstedii]|eukprot:XP_024571863.1 hypothetical protein PHALS_11373 [Plasmopara halstedii]
MQPQVELTVSKLMPPAEEEVGGDDVEMQEVEPEPTSTSRELTTVLPEDGAFSPSRDTDATAERWLRDSRIGDCGIDEQRRAPLDRQ